MSIKKFTELTDTSTFAVSYDYVTYDSSLKTIPDTLLTFAKQFTLFTEWFKLQRKLYMGPSQDIFLWRYYAIFDLSLIDPNLCGSIVLTYPGQTVYFNPNYVDANGCLDLASQYGELWTRTITRPGLTSLVQYQLDPFFSTTCTVNCTGYVALSTTLK